MKQLGLKYWPSARSAINILTGVALMVICASDIYGQGTKECAYRLMGDIIAQDTVIPDHKFRMLAERVRLGKLTQQDSAKYVQSVRGAKLQLYRYESNGTALRLLKEDLESNGKVTMYLTPEVVRKAINEIPSVDSPHDKRLVPDHINLISTHNNREIYHKCSAPIKVGDNRYIFYHYKKVSLSNKTLEFIVFYMDGEGRCQIEKEIVLYHH